MAETTPRGIQATLFDYFQDTEYFDLQEANELLLEHQQRDINAESIRARIYEGIDKGLFERVGKGLYTVTRKDEQGRENTCLLINGDGRDVSFLPDNSIDCCIRDHPYLLPNSLQGRNRNFAKYELFQYDEKDMLETYRILKPGCFLVEFLPEENADNYQYLFKVKEMARKAGLEYFAKVGWKKGNFVANTGRKSKNTEDVCFFTKGRARELRPNAQKNKAEPGVEHFMSGAAGMLPTQFDVAPPKHKIHQAEKPTELLEQILSYVTLPGETALDQYAGSGVLGEAALNTGRNCILIEKDVESFKMITQRMQVLGSLEAPTVAAKTLVSLGSDAIVAREAFLRSGDRNIIYDFVKEHKMPDPAVLYQGEKDLYHKTSLTKEQQEVVSEAFNAIEDLDLRSEDLDLDTTALEAEKANSDGATAFVPEKFTPKSLECSSRGDRRFSALFATVTIKGKTQSIEEWYQNAKRNNDGKRAGKGKPFDHIVDPFTGDQFPAKAAADLYRGLWITYLTNNPELVKYAEQFDNFTNQFSGKGLENSPEEVIGAYVKGNRDWYVASVKCSDWYKNMARKLKKPLAEQIQDASSRSAASFSADSGAVRKSTPER